MGITCILCIVNQLRNSYKTSIGFYKFSDKIRNLPKVPVQPKSTAVHTIWWKYRGLPVHRFYRAPYEMSSFLGQTR